MSAIGDKNKQFKKKCLRLKKSQNPESNAKYHANKASAT